MIKLYRFITPLLRSLWNRHPLPTYFNSSKLDKTSSVKVGEKKSAAGKSIPYLSLISLIYSVGIFLSLVKYNGIILFSLSILIFFLIRYLIFKRYNQSYNNIIEELQNNQGATSAKTRFDCAVKTFEHTAKYDGNFNQVFFR